MNNPKQKPSLQSKKPTVAKLAGCLAPDQDIPFPTDEQIREILEKAAVERWERKERRSR